ncbi:hypothetical protein PPL_04805 [Heterostelium album PN500]|uniref:O-methyltransferase n=1 Tax=Heterostelium pallidum (strain ATCC 26659 / Pp 5 / PN500) TaxID=670386 RepID=D3B8L2_HETP5|nr:hypothetical protein PPL_04805 [Heterostelium album PN500]EFA82380.1 hypothetical protein PPL_04805 [Heterostelium album PN500]|eukprot:XP_020434497.1 hypothetical protein PPL_04805 [Heterostelium album PN500]
MIYYLITKMIETQSRGKETQGGQVGSGKVDSGPVMFLSQICDGLEKSRAIYTVCELDVANQLENKPEPVDKLAKEIGCCPDSLYRLMRALTTLEIFKETDDRVFQHTELSEKLRDQRYRDLVLLHGGPLSFNSWRDLTSTIRNGKSDSNKLFGKPSVWEYFKEHRDEEKIYNTAMTTYTNCLASNIVGIGDFSKCETICDIGGGQGAFLTHILKSNKNIKNAINFEQHCTVECNKQGGCPERDQRIKDHPGDFFTDKIPEADIYIMKSILHNWTDDQAVKVLKNVANSMKQGSKLYVYDIVLGNEKNEQQGVGVWLDIKMFQLMNGRERSLKEFEKIAREAGVKIGNVQKTPQSFSPSLIEFQKA